LDKYLVTVGRFRQFVNAVFLPDGGTGWRPSDGAGKHAHLNGGLGLVDVASLDAGTVYEPGWLSSDNASIAPSDNNLKCISTYATWTSAPSSQENLPINCVNWYEAYAFCIWDGGFLPSEAEWEYAAAGGDQQLQYPWGATPPGSANQYAIFNDLYSLGPSDGGASGAYEIAPVGSAPSGAGRWGQLDLAGDIWEWNLDLFASYVDPCTDCAYVTGSNSRVYRGGAFFSPQQYLQPVQREYTLSGRYDGIGFRCARAP
jgi:formylglycine-generating enzyme required for sulfatase activity